MFKTIFKELFIVILLLIAIGLFLGILFYDYSPKDKIVPIKVEAYSIPEEIKQELEEASPTEQNIVRTYSIESSDLDLYESTNEYDKGKANPFADYSNKGNAQNIQNNTINNNTMNNSSLSDSDNETEVYINTPGKNY